MLILSADTSACIIDHLRAAYPNEGAGLLFGNSDGASPHSRKTARAILPLPNRFEEGEQYHRYLITARDMLDGEMEAARLGLDVIGVFHSHPDHPALASEYDREMALPWYSYLIVSVHSGSPADARAWVLSDDRSQFVEDEFKIENTIC